MIRAFIAIELPEALRRQIASVQEELRSTGADVRWVDPDNVHLTLKFLGSIEESAPETIRKALAEAVEPFPPFVFQVEGLGVFPRMAPPRVVWLGVSEGRERLEQIAAAVEKDCVAQGLPAQDHPFTPHLTIGRIRSNKRLEGLIHSLERFPVRQVSLVQVRRLILLKSTLRAEGPIYTPLAEIALKGPPTR